VIIARNEWVNFLSGGHCRRVRHVLSCFHAGRPLYCHFPSLLLAQSVAMRCAEQQKAGLVLSLTAFEAWSCAWGCQLEQLWPGHILHMFASDGRDKEDR
jgi:hypothetical protein